MSTPRPASVEALGKRLAHMTRDWSAHDKLALAAHLADWPIEAGVTPSLDVRVTRPGAEAAQAAEARITGEGGEITIALASPVDAAVATPSEMLPSLRLAHHAGPAERWIVDLQTPAGLLVATASFRTGGKVVLNGKRWPVEAQRAAKRGAAS